MGLKKNEHSKIERRLSRALRAACKVAENEVSGFAWVTHAVDYKEYPDTLMVTWVFDSPASLREAMENGVHDRLCTLTAEAFAKSGVRIEDATPHVRFDHERTR